MAFIVFSGKLKNGSILFQDNGWMGETMGWTGEGSTINEWRLPSEKNSKSRFMWWEFNKNQQIAVEFKWCLPSHECLSITILLQKLLFYDNSTNPSSIIILQISSTSTFDCPSNFKLQSNYKISATSSFDCLKIFSIWTHLCQLTSHPNPRPPDHHHHDAQELGHWLQGVHRRPEGWCQ